MTNPTHLFTQSPPAEVCAASQLRQVQEQLLPEAIRFKSPYSSPLGYVFINETLYYFFSPFIWTGLRNTFCSHISQKSISGQCE